MSLSELILTVQGKLNEYHEKLDSLEEEMINIMNIPNDDDKRKHKEKCRKEIQSNIDFILDNRRYLLIKFHALSISLQEEELERIYILIKNIESEDIDETEPEDIRRQKENLRNDLEEEYNQHKYISRVHMQAMLMSEYPDQNNNNNQEPEHNNQEPEHNNQEPEHNNQEPEHNNQEPEHNNQEPEHNNNQEPEHNNNQAIEQNIEIIF